MPFFREIEGRLKAKCDTLTDAFLVDDIGQSCRHTLSFSPFANITPCSVYLQPTIWGQVAIFL